MISQHVVVGVINKSFELALAYTNTYTFPQRPSVFNIVLISALNYGKMHSELEI